MDLNDGIASLHKKITTKFQEGAEYGTIIDGESIKMQLPPRLAICTSSVDIHGDEQYRDRWADVPIDESQTKDIIEFQQHADTLSVRDDIGTFATDVCRYIYSDLANKRFFVEIPFAEEFYFPEKERPRGYGMFSDIIKSFTVLRSKIRVKNEFDHLVATAEDFWDAKAIYEGMHGHSDRKFAVSERKFLQAMIDLRYEADVKQLSAKMGVGGPRVRAIANGRGNDEQKRNGLLAKCPELTVEAVSVSAPDTYDSNVHVTTKKFIYHLEDTFELMNDITELIHIKSGSKTLSTDRKYHRVSEDTAMYQPPTDSSRTDDIKDIVKEDKGGVSAPLYHHKSLEEMGIVFESNDTIDQMKKATTVSVPAPAKESERGAFTCKCLNDIVGCFDRYADIIYTPHLSDNIGKFGANYIQIRGRLEDHGWKYNGDNRTMTHAQVSL
jgi:hypothetical protein